ncbi:MAG: VTT domain-containing protein [Verrucomicrobiota bacterium]|nr:VTT domain-containing protein [Verrucomicrobiota bacterium]
MPALTDWLTSSAASFQQLGWIGLLAYAGGMVLVAMAGGPLSPLAVAAGAMFGLSHGLLVVTLGVNASAAVNFLVSRYLARGVMTRRLQRYEKFRLIDAAVGREGWKLIALFRFVPMPFGIANYAFGLTAIRFWPYLLATALATSAGNLFFTWLGVTARTGIQAAAGGGPARHPGEYVFLVIGLAAAFVALWYVTRIARTALVKAAPLASID